MTRPLLLAALACLPLLGAPPTAQAQGAEVLACGRNGTVMIAGRVHITLYTGNNEARWDSGWQSVLAGQQYCARRHDVRAMNVTVQILGSDMRWHTVCNQNRRPGTSLVASVTESGMQAVCVVQ